MAKRIGVGRIDVKALYYAARRRTKGPYARVHAWTAVRNALNCEAVINLMWEILDRPVEGDIQRAALTYIANPTLAFASMRRVGGGHPDYSKRRPRRRWRSPQ